MPGRITIRHTRIAVLSLLLATALITAWGLVRSSSRRHSEEPPAAKLPAHVAQSEGFSLSKSEEGRTLFTVRAKRAREQRRTRTSILEEVEIIAYGGQGGRHDRIYSKLCEYDAQAGVIRSQGDVEIELASLPGQPPATFVPAPDGGQLPRASVFVRTSGLSFEEKTGIASTDQELEFHFAEGAGRATGAVYDSARGTLLLQSNVAIEARAGALDHLDHGRPGEPASRPAATPATPPVVIRADRLLYTRAENRIELVRAELRRAAGGETRTLAGDAAVLFLNERSQAVSAEVKGNARLDQAGGGRRSQLAAERLELYFGQNQRLDRAQAFGAVRLDTQSASGRTEARAAEAAVFFDPRGKARATVWRGDARLLLASNRPGAGTRLLTSDWVEIGIRPETGEIENARTPNSGRLEIIPAAGAPDSRHVLTARQLWMGFGPRSQLRTLVAENEVRLESQAPPRNPRDPKVPEPAPRTTTSDKLTASFHADSQELETIDQTGNFRYAEGGRQARADRAHYTASSGAVVLTGAGARHPEVWDPATRTSAERITLNEKTGEGAAERQVRSLHLPESVADAGGGERRGGAGFLDSGEAVHVLAARMVTNSRSGMTRYEAGAGQRRVRLWQNQDVIEARTVDLDRKGRRLEAAGDVVTVLVEAASGPVNGTPPLAGARTPQRSAGPARVVIAAERLVYTETDRRAHYEKGVVLRRGDTTLKADALDAWLAAGGAVKPGESRLQRALATGGVDLREVSPSGARRAAAERAEYWTAEEKVVLSGGQPYVFDEQRGYTRGRQLTYLMRDDTIFVHGDNASRTITEQRVESRR